MRELDVFRLLFIQNSGNLLHGSPPLSISSMSAIVTDMASFSVDGHLKLIPKQESLLLNSSQPLLSHTMAVTRLLSLPQKMNIDFSLGSMPISLLTSSDRLPARFLLSIIQAWCRCCILLDDRIKVVLQL